MNKLIYKPFSLAFGIAGGMLAGAAFKQIWKRVSGEEQAPEATSLDYSWGEVLLAAAVQGAIFAVVRAAVDRGGAAGVRKLTGEWPADKK
jgi:predicted metal-dependent enzyme (double-stranded beta helix superfamily)